MYVCICHGFTEKKVKQALASGVCTTAGLFNCMGCKPQCGKCVPYVRKMVNDHRGALACANTCSPPIDEEAAIAAE
ncbi:bacterioferritin-associated ferredoxin [Skermanella stibiiresistens SB22]|jgi:bacterioferritin-associated ferredoxin|uniref:Bacterioferritin-associated ferredoxin n=1 Tax=Skermanella stibiiresistens SB22 TaxID=1385369 RepID=W9H6Z5_9PROT|nr:(2Fe-2S)-binding protein [Skermanella stibiiresistens]EWY41804.1 bacterioferritin-associated ferredoxin [Skermanella stibiiresistens SB22]